MKVSLRQVTGFHLSLRYFGAAVTGFCPRLEILETREQEKKTKGEGRTSRDLEVTIGVGGPGQWFWKGK